MAREKNFPFHLDHALGDIVNYNSWCIPIRGPVPANVLVTISGIAVLNLDTNLDLDTESEIDGDIYIITSFGLKPTDTLVDASTIVTLARISADDSTEVLFALDEVEVGLNENRFIQMRAHIVVGGDIALDRIAFQANVVIGRVQFESTDGCDY